MRLIVIVFIFLQVSAFGQNYNGLVLNTKDQKPLGFVNIGIVGKNIGTISDENGKYNLVLDNKFNNDTLKFSLISFELFSIKVSDYKLLSNKNIALKEKYYKLNEVVISPKAYKQKTLGYTTNSKVIRAGFERNDLGYECGVLLKIKKSAILETLNLNVVSCTFDTIFYRINLYKVVNRKSFENILTGPIYFKIPKTKIKDKIIIDLLPYNLNVYGDCLVTLEHIKVLGKGSLWFCASFPGKTYFRKTSQGEWDSAPVGISFSVNAKIEK
jgi:hypothetical protein